MEGSRHFHTFPIISSDSFEDAGLLSAVEVRSLDSFDPPTRPLQFLLEERTLGVEFVLLTISRHMSIVMRLYNLIVCLWLYIECIDN